MHNTTLESLLENNTTDLKLSLYQPTHPASSVSTVKEDVIRFKNALQDIRAHGLYDNTLDHTMQTLHELVDDVEFWKHQSRGLALFADAQGYHTVRMHYDVAEALFVGDQFQLSPLVLEESLGSHYYLLDINHTRPRLLVGSPSQSTELVIDNMPDSFESMTENVEFSKELQHQSGGVGAFHGHSDENALLDNTKTYYRHIARAVDTFLEGHKEQLLLIGVENGVGSMRKVLTYPHILDNNIEGSGEAMNEQQLHEASTKSIETFNTERRRQIIHTFEETLPALTAVGIEAVQAALAESRVATLLVPSFRRTTDTVREGFDTAIVLELNDNADATESLVRGALEQGGEVIALATDSFADEQPRALCRF